MTPWLHRVRSVSTSGSMGSTGLFAKMVAKFLVKWVKKTLNKKRGSAQPALSATPSTVTGRPERDRSRENYGQHTGSQGPRDRVTNQTTTLQGDDYGQHTGSSGPRAASAQPQTAPLMGGNYGHHTGSSGPRPSGFQTPPGAFQGGNYGEHTGVSPRPRLEVAPRNNVVFDPRSLDRQLASLWNGGEQRRNTLRQADPEGLRQAGLNDRQVAQAGNGRVPQGYRCCLSADAQSYELTPVNQQSQINSNAINHQIISLQFGDVSLISLPIGGQQVTIVLGGGAVLAR